MVKAILKEIEIRKDYLSRDTINTIYFGGGTPSLLDSNEIKSILNKVRQTYIVSVDAEITIEANPEDMDDVKLSEWSKAGINRLSVGIQSFIESELTLMNRNHSAEESTAALKRAKENGFTNISADLIFGVPYSTKETWQYNLDCLTALGVSHMSCYALTIEPHTALSHQIKNMKTIPVEPELASDQFMMAHNFLTASGFDHYEISNYGKQDQYSRHNSSYWRQVKYMGIGPSAHSFDGKSRQWNIAHNPKYIDALANNLSFFECEKLSDTDIFNENLMTGLRTKDGVDLSQLKFASQRAEEEFILATEKLIMSKQLIQSKNNRLVIPVDKWIIADHIISELFLC